MAQEHTFFIRNFRFENLTFCDPRLTWHFSVVDLYEVRMQNDLDFWIKCVKVTINHVSHARKRIVYFCDLSWPDLDPDPCLVWHLRLQGIFNSPLMSLWPSFEQKLSISPALSFIIPKRQKLTFDLTLTRVLTSLIWFRVRFGEVSLSPLDCRLARLDTIIGSRDTRVGVGPDPLPPLGRGYGNSPAVAV